MINSSNGSSSNCGSTLFHGSDFSKCPEYDDSQRYPKQLRLIKYELYININNIDQYYFQFWFRS